MVSVEIPWRSDDRCGVVLESVEDKEGRSRIWPCEAQMARPEGKVVDDGYGENGYASLLLTTASGRSSSDATSFVLLVFEEMMNREDHKHIAEV